MISQCCNKNGFTLVEVMVAMLIITVGLLGLTAMQATALKATGMGGNTTVANNLTRDVAERIFKNASNVGAYEGMDTLSGATPNCPTLNPPPVCRQDFIDWQASASNLSQGRLRITSQVVAGFDSVLVTVSWQDAMGNHNAILPFQVAP